MSINQCNGSEGNGMVYAIRQASQQDGPGMRTVVQFKGCSFSCWWCPEPELQSFGTELRLEEGHCVRCGKCVNNCTVDAAREDGPTELDKHYSVDREICIVCGACIENCQGHARELVGRCMSVGEVLEQLLPDLALFQQTGGGVTFAGGEPLLQIDFLSQLLRACKAQGLHTAVDTSGYAPWQFFERIRADVDLFLYELKIMDAARHQQFTGLSNDLIVENLRRLSALGQRIILRVPVVPGITDDADNLNAITQFAAGLPQLEGISLIPYARIDKETYERLGKPYHVIPASGLDAGHLADLVQQLQASGLAVHVTGQ